MPRLLENVILKALHYLPASSSTLPSLPTPHIFIYTFIQQMSTIYDCFRPKNLGLWIQSGTRDKNVCLHRAYIPVEEDRSESSPQGKDFQILRRWWCKRWVVMSAHLSHGHKQNWSRWKSGFNLIAHLMAASMWEERKLAYKICLWINLPAAKPEGGRQPR